MFAAIAIRVPLMVLPFMQLPQPTRDCSLEVVTPQAMEERAALAEFDATVQDYVRLHRRLTRSLPVPPMFDEEDDLFLTADLRAALVAARPQAGQGAFFTPSVSLMLKQRIDEVFLHHPAPALHVMFRGGYDPLPGEPRPVVNQPFPPVVASVRWLPLTRALPELPHQLDFALWGRDLVLLDVAANLVIDVLPGALPPAAGPGVVYQ